MLRQDTPGPCWKFVCQTVAAQASVINDITNVAQPLLLLSSSASSFLFLGVVQ